MKLTKLQAIGIKTETTQGTAATISATDFIVTENVDVNIVPELLARDFRRSSLDSLAHVIGKRSVTVKFKTELKGSGTAGTVYAPLDAAIQACGFTSSATAGTSVVYAPTSTAASGSFYGPGKSCTLSVFKHGLNHIVSGALGNFKFSAEAGKYPTLDFEFKGVYSAVTDQSMPTQTVIATLPPIWQGSTVSVLGSTLVVDKWEFSPNAVTTERTDATAATAIRGFVITDRKPTGQIEVEGESVSTYDFFGKLITSTSGACSLTIGATAGNITTISQPSCQFNDVQYADRNNLQIFQLPYAANQNTGDDWCTITLT